jgi:alpha-D-xyloside xylohydrolase
MPHPAHRHRGDLLKGPVMTISCHSPMPDVIGVTLTHFDGEVDRGPHFALAESDTPAQVSYDDEYALLVAGSLALRVARSGPWQLDFLTADGLRPLTSSGLKAMGIMQKDSGEHYLREQLNLAVGTNVYGLGERFGPLVKNGQVVDIWNADGGTATEQAYKNVLFYLADAGYGVFVDHPGRVSLEVGSEAVSRVQFSVEGQELTYYVIHGPTPKEILRKYTALTGRPALPPAWSFGLWLSTSFTASYDEETVTSFIDGMAERDLPLSVFHFDCFWMREFNWCDFTWDPRVFHRSAGHARPAEGEGPAHLRVDQPVHRAALPALRRGPPGRLPAEEAGWRRVAVGPVAAGHGARGLLQPAREPGTRSSWRGCWSC